MKLDFNSTNVLTKEMENTVTPTSLAPNNNLSKLVANVPIQWLRFPKSLIVFAFLKAQCGHRKFKFLLHPPLTTVRLH